jgi:hypothetical protein
VIHPGKRKKKMGREKERKRPRNRKEDAEAHDALEECQPTEKKKKKQME